MEDLAIENTWDPYIKEKELGNHMRTSDIFFELARDPSNTDLQNSLMELIKKYNMAEYYKEVVEQLHYPFDEALYQSLQEKNKADIQEIDKKIETAKEAKSVDDVLDLYIAKAKLLFQIGQKENCLKAFEDCFEQSLSNNMTIDLNMSLIDVGLFYQDEEIIKKYYDITANLISKGCDWEHKNRFKIYEGIQCLRNRNIEKACNNFVTCIPTFTSYSLFPFEREVFYSIITSICTKSRLEIKKQLVDSSDVIIVLSNYPLYKQLLYSFYNCNYKEFFLALLELESVMLNDKYLSSHVHYLMRELRIQSYLQFLKSYKTCTMSTMANAFGVSVAFIDKELSRFISAGRINAKIDKIGNVIETKNDESECYYTDLLTKGDILIDKIQQLGRNINI